jgi:hypothetical protein
VDFVVCTLAVKKESGQISTCRIGPFPCQSQCLNFALKFMTNADINISTE